MHPKNLYQIYDMKFDGILKRYQKTEELQAHIYEGYVETLLNRINTYIKRFA